jgi:hypothetical protein
MRTLFVGYDLNKPGQNYTDLIDALKSYPAWWHYLDSTWLIRTNDSVSDIRDHLGALIDSGDELLVMEVTGTTWASKGLSKKANDWLYSSL